MRLKRIPNLRCTAGCWATEDARFIIERNTQAPARGRWCVLPVYWYEDDEVEWLRAQGLYSGNFSTRREALLRLEDALQIMPPPRLER